MQVGSLLVTGASRGIGLELIKQSCRLPRPPHHIFAGCRNPDQAQELQEVAEKHKAVCVLKLDVTNDADISSAVQSVQNVVGDAGLNVLFNNAGIYDKGFGRLRVQTRENLRNHFDTNAIAPILLSQNFLPLLRKAVKANRDNPFGVTKAAIVNISAIMGSIAENPKYGGFYPYRTSKCALNMATHCLKLELEGHGIAVVAMHPGWTNTDMGGEKAPVPLADSVSGMFRVLAGLRKEQSGLLLNYKGQQLQW